MRVAEIYKSIQGESTFAGLPCTLVRFTGCNLRCVWCDTPHAFSGGEEKSRAEVLAEVQRLGVPLVLLTGGEPLLQREVPVLAADLLAQGFTVLVETGGSLDISVLPQGCVTILDLKCPGSGEVDRNCWENLNRLRPGDELKLVLADQSDYLWARDVLARKELPAFVEVLLSPVHGVLDPRDLARWMLADGLRARLHLQLHKYIWGPNVRSV
jgi:7-carboxy-7-deazaguanine synthase